MINLKFARGKDNSKLRKLEEKVGPIWHFSLSSGHSCTFAKNCKSSAVRNNSGNLMIVDGQHTEFRCFSASQEALYLKTYNARKHNYDIMRSFSSDFRMTEILHENINHLSPQPNFFRIHIGGEFFNPIYFAAWCNVASLNSDIQFYAYTKSLPYWVKLLGRIPSNLRLTASFGGYRDDLIEKYGLRKAVVVYSEAEAEKLGLEIDHDDSHAALPEYEGKDFALLIHGVQPAGTQAAKALQQLKALKRKVK